MAPRRGRRQAGVVAVVTRPDPLEATVAGHTARRLTATTYCQPGRSNTDAAQLIESLRGSYMEGLQNLRTIEHRIMARGLIPPPGE